MRFVLQATVWLSGICMDDENIGGDGCNFKVNMILLHSEHNKSSYWKKENKNAQKNILRELRKQVCNACISKHILLNTILSIVL